MGTVSFIEMKNFYSIKLKKTKTHRKEKAKRIVRKSHERNFRNSSNFPMNFLFG